MRKLLHEVMTEYGLACIFPDHPLYYSDRRALGLHAVTDNGYVENKE